ncbi:hypothetical protein PoB_002720500 [Plakobranchus ocellatus]|uniref:Uncharacterized protein n=1 Tax=Plakobranchus ocellatus TaxID=259542 RepID=A0AAV3ZXU6_9GAST|nr:hypothetical protein PoB_002720500 [Plakobranchus ocellatus]
MQQKGRYIGYRTCPEICRDTSIGSSSPATDALALKRPESLRSPCWQAICTAQGGRNAFLVKWQIFPSDQAKKAPWQDSE